MRKIFKIPLFGLAAVVFTVIVVLALYFFTSLPEQQINRWFGYYVAAKTGYRVKIGKINRDLWHRIEADDITVTYETENQVIPIADLAHVEANYSLRGLIARHIYLHGVLISGLKVNVPIDETGGIAIPHKTDGQGTAKSSLPKIEIGDFNIIATQITLNTPTIGHIIKIDRLSGSLNAGNANIALKIDTLIGGYPEKDFALTSCSGAIDLADGALTITSLNIASSNSKIFLSGKLGKLNAPDIDMSYSFFPLNFGDISKLTGIELRGMAHVEGDIAGNFKEFSGKLAGGVTLFDKLLKNVKTGYHYKSGKIEFSGFDGIVFESPIVGNGYLDLGQKPAKFGFRGSTSNLNLRNIDLQLYSSFSGDVDLSGQGLSDRDLKMAIDMHLAKADIDIYHFHEAIGRIEFDLKKLNFAPGFKARYKDTWVKFSGFLEYTGQLDIEGDAEFANLANFQNQFFIADLDGLGKSHFKVTGPTLDFAVAGNFHSDSCRFYGLQAKNINVDLNLHNFISHKTGTVGGVWKNALLYSIPVDSGYFSVSVAGDKFFLDRVFWKNKNNRVEFSGQVDNTVIPPAFIVDTMMTILWSDTIFSARPMLMDIDTNQVEFEDFALAYKSGKAELTGTVTFKNQMDLRLNFAGLEITPITKYLNFPKKLSGMLSGKMTASGNFELPEFAADFNIAGFAIDDVIQGNFELHATYKNRLLDLMSAELKGENSLFRLSGEFPIELSFTYAGDRFLNLPFSARLVVSGNDLPIVPIFVPSIEYFRGKYSATISLGGTYDKPLASGSFELANGSVKPLELVDPITGININGRMENDLVYIDRIEAMMKPVQKGLGNRFDGYPVARLSKAKESGVVSGKGTIKLLGIGLFDYDLNISGKNCEFYTDSYDIHGMANLDLTVTGSAPPIVKGRVMLTRLDMKEPFATFSTGVTEKTEILEDSTIWNLEIEITALNNLWIKNSDADMELMGNVLVLRQAGIQHLLGQLDIIRGNFYLFNYKFKIQKGEMIFNNIAVIDPDISFDVTTRIRGTTPGELLAQSNFGYEDLNLMITGTLSKPTISSASDSIHSNEDILMVLLADRFNVTNISRKGTGSLTDNIINNMKDYAFVAFSQVERIGVFDELDINPNADSLGQTSVSVAKYLSPKLFLRYSRGLSQQSGEAIGVEYMFNNNLSFEGRQGTKNEGISFGLNFKYEF